MLIANPIFDTIFKRLMEDKRIAKFFIETLIDEEIVDLTVMPQEYSFLKELKQLDSTITDAEIAKLKRKLKNRSHDLIGLTTFRMDFIATVKMGDNELKKVIIEIQKAMTATAVGRFRRYLGEQYKKEDEVEIDGLKEKTYLPIISIYLLGFRLNEIESPLIKISRQYIDLATKEIIESKSDFVEKLTHDSFIVQIPRIKPKYRTRLDKLLTVFEQDNFSDDSRTAKFYSDIVDDDNIKLMLKELTYLASSKSMRSILDNEIEAHKWIEDELKESRIDYMKKEKVFLKTIQDKDTVIEENQKLIEEAAKALEEANRLIDELKKQKNN